MDHVMLECGMIEKQLFEQELLVAGAETTFSQSQSLLLSQVEQQRRRLSRLLDVDNATNEQLQFLLLLDQVVMLTDIQKTVDALRHDHLMALRAHQDLRRQNPL